MAQQLQDDLTRLEHSKPQDKQVKDIPAALNQGSVTYKRKNTIEKNQLCFQKKYKESRYMYLTLEPLASCKA
jgi:hypothetical protein